MTQNNKCKVSPSIVNNSPSEDVRVEMEMDAHELMDNLRRHTCKHEDYSKFDGFTRACSKSTRRMELAGLLSYCVLGGLAIFMAYFLPQLNAQTEQSYQEIIKVSRPF